MFAEFMAEYGMEIVSLIITAILGCLGAAAKKLYNRYIDDQTKEKIARIAVRGVEQMYKELHGEEKLTKAMEAAAEMLTERGITTTAFELRMIIEDAVGEFNEAFKKAE